MGIRENRMEDVDSPLGFVLNLPPSLNPTSLLRRGYERRREGATFLGIISPRWMKATWGSDSDPDEEEAADQELPARHCQVFTWLASWKPDIPDSCLGAGTGDAGARGRRVWGGSRIKTLADQSQRWHIRTRIPSCPTGEDFATKFYLPTWLSRSFFVCRKISCGSS